MGEVAGLSKATISRIWRTFGLQSHRLETFKLSADPQFVEKVRDIVGLYLNPPDHALVLCLDEKSQVQALDRTRPLLPMRPGRAPIEAATRPVTMMRCMTSEATRRDPLGQTRDCRHWRLRRNPELIQPLSSPRRPKSTGASRRQSLR
jgi:hypothetical protein